MSKSSPSRMSAARRNAETILSQSRKRQESFKLEQKLAHDAMTEKTARLRELRLAKEAADRDAEAANPPARSVPKTRKVWRSKQT
jgi:hypothetical protein